MSINVSGNIISSTGFDSSGNILNTPTIVTSGLTLWYDAGNLASYYPAAGTGAGYYDCGYGCQYYASNPGCTNCNIQIKDMSGNAYDGSFTNVSVVYNNIGGNMSFNGSGYYVTIGSNAAYASPSKITLDFWCYPTVNGNYQYLISNDRDCCGTYYGYDLNVTNLTPAFQIWNGTSAIVSSSSTISLNTYNHIVATYDGATMLIYVNSVLKGTTNTTLGIGTPASYNTYLGRMGLDPFYAFSGYITISRIYNRALNSTEILQNFNTDRQRFGI